MVIVDTHVHVFTDDRRKYPQIRDTERAGSIPTITEIGQTEWPLTTAEILLRAMDEAGIAQATLVQAYFVYEYLSPWRDVVVRRASRQCVADTGGLRPVKRSSGVVCAPSRRLDAAGMR